MSLPNVEKCVKNLYEEMNQENSFWKSDPEKFKKKFIEENNEIHAKYPAVFNIVFNPQFDSNGLERLLYMLKMAKRVADNEIPEHDASVAVGQRLVDDMVKPQLNNKK